jgi:SAM-dependent methyltransferase
MSTGSIQPHNLRPAATWNAGGEQYDRISESIADSIEHAVIRLDPQAKERVLDVATGTGWTARRVATRGARVVGLDLGADLIGAADRLAARAGLEIEFKVGDAEQLMFEDESFDAAISTCGVMFVTRPEAAAAELARVIRKGGRLALTTWTPDGAIAGMFQVMRPYMAPPPSPPPPSPFAWGDQKRVEELLGRAFDLRFELGTSVLRAPSGEWVWELFATSYGPTRALAGSLEPERREVLRRDFVAYHERFRGVLGIAMPREYLVIVGTRRSSRT